MDINEYYIPRSCHFHALNPPNTAHLLRPMKAPSVASGKPRSNDSKPSKGKKAAKKAAAKKPRKSPKGDKANGSKGE